MLRSSLKPGCDDKYDSREPLFLGVVKSFLSLIKLQCGNSSVVKIEGMLNDLYVSDTTNAEFEELFLGQASSSSSHHCEESSDERHRDSCHPCFGSSSSVRPLKTEGNEDFPQAGQGVQLPSFHVMLLTQGFWPSLSCWNDQSAIILPKPLGK